MEYGRPYRGPLRAVVLDWAGTTLDYGCIAPAVVFVEVFRRHGVEITMDEARAPMGAHKKVHLRTIAQLPTVAWRWERTHGRPPDESDVEGMFAEFVPLQLACLADYADLIPGTVEVVAELRRRVLKIGSTTGYMLEMQDVLRREARNRGYEPDVCVCAAEVPEGRPAPWMCFENAKRLGVYPMSSVVKVGDTLPDIAEGLNAGMWTIGVAQTGNEVGLQEREIGALAPEDLRRRLERAYTRMRAAGAHYVVDGIWDVPAALDQIESRLLRGEGP